MVGIVDVAARAGVSVATVSRALRGLPGVAEATRQAVRAAAAELGYVASPSAAGLPTGRTGAVGIVAPWITRWFFTAVIEGAAEVLVERGHDLLLYDLGGVAAARRRVLDTKLLTKRVDALLVLSLPLTAAEVDSLSRLHRPVATVGPTVPGLSGVRIDDVDVGRTAAEHLIELGHRRIAFVGGDPHDELGFPVAPDRRSGYEMALRAAGIEPDRDLAVPAEFTVDSGTRAWATLRNRTTSPTAVVAASDEIAMGVLYAARQCGLRVPRDLSVVGVDDHDMARLFDLTTVAQPVREQGRIAARLLIEQLATTKGVVEQVVTVPTRLMVRSTTAPPVAQPLPAA
ncbi:MAG TPA: LacI family DNA-binding transcriptional regulator [Jiangellaceae bacterium]|nr:LacI family DNA-binding transcriptional regulator [Jiangellaceae bacterium]